MGEMTDHQALMRLRALSATSRDQRWIGATWMVGLRLEVSTAKARTIMNRLAKTGKVERSERYSAVNSIAWVFPKEASND